MKLAVPVHSDELIVFGNAGHTPFFAVFEIAGAGMFRTTKLVDLRANPRAKPDEEAPCNHDHDDEEHKNEHRVMADILKDCDALLVVSACKNTKLVLEEAGVTVHAVRGAGKADQLVAAYLAKK